jgi:two-component system chemotaxis response regulator CheY
MCAAKKILVVDDSLVVVHGVEFILRKKGFETSSAHSVDAALALLEGPNSFLPDLVLADLNMEGKSGFDLVRTLKANAKWNKIPILMLTTESSREAAAEGKALGLSGWMVKPFAEDHLVSAIVKLTGAL